MQKDDTTERAGRGNNSGLGRFRTWLSARDPVLVTALVISLIFSLYGIGWGRVESWNLDELALQPLHGLRPHGYLKPPFHTYVNHLLVLEPINLFDMLVKYLGGKHHDFAEAKLLGSGLVVICLSLGTICLAYAISVRSFGRFAARVSALTFATSAGFVEYSHFLTADSPLLFWMLLALLFEVRILFTHSLADYLLSGFLTGVCSATKYNGIAVGIGIVSAHLLARDQVRWKETLLDRRLWLGLGLVPIGFLCASPFVIFDSRKFIVDFMYNYYVTPRYEGQQGHGYFQFLARLPEVLGWPGTVIVCFATTLSIFLVVRSWHSNRVGAKTFLVLASVFLLYFAKIGSFSRVPTRFVLPAVPFLVLMAGPLWQRLRRRQRSVALILAPTLLYNTLCCFVVGQRFSSDPRSVAQHWMESHVHRGSVIESSWASPHWTRLPGLNGTERDLAKMDSRALSRGLIVDLRMPKVTGRAELFSKIFQGNRWVMESLDAREGRPDDQLFTIAELQKRNPDYIAAYSADYVVPNETVKSYYSNLLEGQFPYDIAADGESTVMAPFWLYPRQIDFLGGRITILKRRQKRM